VRNQPLVMITEDQVRDALPLDRSIALSREAMSATAQGTALDSVLSYLPAPEGEFHLKASGLTIEGRLYVAVKIGACFYGRPAQLGLPSIVGLIQLFDGSTGQPLAVMESALITKLRTAATTAVAADALARRDARTVTICGVGEQAIAHAMALTRVRTLDQITLWGRTHTAATAAAQQLTALVPEIRVTAEADLQRAVSSADMIVTLTAARAPFLTGDLIRPGTFIAGVGSDAPDKNEIEPAVLAGATVVCDVIHQCARVGELHHAIDAGLMNTQDVAAELGAVLTGAAPGRSTQDQTIIFDSTGTAVQDTAAAVAVYRAAKDAPDTLSFDLWN